MASCVFLPKRNGLRVENMINFNKIQVFGPDSERGALGERVDFALHAIRLYCNSEACSVLAWLNARCPPIICNDLFTD